MAKVREHVAINPFDRITEDNEVGIRKPIKKTRRVRVKPPRTVFGGENGNQEFIYF
jgi:hypothetical protein